jgi:hypothetical protein
MNAIQQDIFNQFKKDGLIFFEYGFYFGEERILNKTNPILKRNPDGGYRFEFLDRVRSLSFQIQRKEDLTIENIESILQELFAFLKEDFVVKNGQIVTQDMDSMKKCWIEEYGNIFNIL